MSRFLASSRQAWDLTKPYFFSEERWYARGLLGFVIVLNLFNVFLGVVANFWNRDFFNAIQAFDKKSIFALLLTYLPGPLLGGFMPGLVWIVIVAVLNYVYSTYLQQMLQIRWRRWMTTDYVNNWLADRAYYNISLGNMSGTGVDNPDQRISEDLRMFTQNMLNTLISFISNLVNLFSFVFVLYAVSGSITLLGIVIPGYMLWVAFLYSAVGTYFTYIIGRRLIRLSFDQQKFEANFRYSLVRVRDNPEAIALYAGENEEKLGLTERFEAVFQNFWSIMRRTKALNFFTTTFSQLAGYFPLIVALPRYLSHAIGLGGLTQIQDAFGQVQGSLSWFVGAFSDSTTNQDLVNLRATIIRLHGFTEAVTAARAASANGPQAHAEGDTLTLHNLSLSLPDGKKLLENADLTLPPGEKIILTGPSGAGKSTLFRAIAGIWPHGEGQVKRPAGSAMFLPQRPYFPQGTLKRAITYPNASDATADADIINALTDVGLENLIPRLQETENWGQILSGGEQQRLAITRALIAQPNWLFLDEATAALDTPMANQVNTVLATRLPTTTIVSITHRDSVVPPQRHIALAGGVLGEVK